MLTLLRPLVGGGGFRWLLRLLIRVVIWHFVVQTVGGFLARYTHLPPLVNVLILIAVIVVVRFVVVRRQRRRV